jgi:pimeloyl-ACP methyl ester carboxylesterase
MLAGVGGIELAADHYPADGSTPVLLLHGGGQTRHAWGATGETLAAQGWPTTAVDLRGHGESAWAPDGGYAMEFFAGDVGALVASLPEAPVLVGASLGGLASMLALQMDPGLPVRGLVLVDIAHRVDRDGVRRITRFMQAKPEGFEDRSEASDAVSEYLSHRDSAADSTGLASHNLRLHEGRWRWHWDPSILDAFPAETDPGIVRQRERRMAAVVQSLHIPALLVRGGDSDVVTPAIAEEFAALTPMGEVVDVPGARHMVAGDSNDVFTAAVLEFLERRIGRS